MNYFVFTLKLLYKTNTNTITLYNELTQLTNDISCICERFLKKYKKEVKAFVKRLQSISVLKILPKFAIIS